MENTEDFLIPIDREVKKNFETEPTWSFGKFAIQKRGVYDYFKTIEIMVIQNNESGKEFLIRAIDRIKSLVVDDWQASNLRLIFEKPLYLRNCYTRYESFLVWHDSVRLLEYLGNTDEQMFTKDVKELPVIE